MGSWLIICGLTAALASGAVEPPPAADPSPAAIQRAIADLGDPSYGVRERATRFLWQQGLAAEAALNAAAASPDPEVRLRAAGVLDDFRHGVLPGVPADVVALIHDFRAGSAQQRQAALQQLATRGQFGTLQRLVLRESDPNRRRQLMVSLLQHPRAVARFSDLQALRDFVEAAGADQDEQWRRTVYGQLLVTDRMIVALAGQDRLAVLAQVLEAEKSGHVRREILSALFGNQAAVGVLLEKDQLDFILQSILREADQTQRANWLNQLVSGPSAGAALVRAERLEKLILFVYENLQGSQRDRFLRTLTQNPAVGGALWKDGLEGLVKLAARESEPAARGRLLATLVTAPAIRQQALDPAFADAVLKWARDEQNAAARGEFLRILADRGALRFLFRETGHRRTIWQLVKAEAAADWRGDVLVPLVAHSTPEQLLAGKPEAAWLLRFAAQEALPRQTDVLIPRIFGDARWLGAMIEHGQLAEALKLGKRQAEEQRLEMWRQVVNAQDLAKQLAAARQMGLLVTLAKEEDDAYVRRQYLEALFQNAAVMTALVADGQYDALLALVQAEQGPASRAALVRVLLSTEAALKPSLEKTLSLLRDERHEHAHGALLAALLAAPKLQQHLAARDEAGKVFEWLRGQEDEGARRLVLQGICQQPETVLLLIERGRCDGLLASLQRETRPAVRGPLLAALITRPDVLQRLARAKRLETLMTQARSLEDPAARRPFLQTFLANGAGVVGLLEKEHFEILWELVADEPELQRQGTFLGQFLSMGKPLEYLPGGKLNLLLDAIARQEDLQVRRDILRRLTCSDSAIAALISRGQFDQLVKLCRASSEAGTIRAMTVELLLSVRAADQLDKLGSLRPIVEETLADPASRVPFLERLMERPAALNTLAAKGCVEPLYQASDEEPDAARRRRLLNELLGLPSVIQSLASGGRLPGLLKRITAAGDFSLRRQVVLSLTRRPPCQRLLADPQLAADLVQLIKAEPAGVERRRFAEWATEERAVWQALVYSGQSERLFELTALLPNTVQTKAATRQILYSPSGVIPHHLWRGDEAEAARRLEQAADNDLGRMRLASYLLTAGPLEERIAAVQQRRDPQTAAADARLLTYLARAHGDLAAARRAAGQSGDDGLVRAVAVEQRDWAEAARLQAAGPCPLPIRTYTRPPDDPQWLQIEQLGLTAAYQRLAGQNAACGQTLAGLRQWADRPPPDRDYRWMTVEALLLNDRVEEGLALLAETLPTRAFDLYFERQQFREAFALARWPGAAAVDPAWLTSLPTATACADGERTLLQFDLVLQILRALHALGQQAEAGQLAARLEAFAQEQVGGDHTSGLRRQCWERLGHALARLGRTPHAFEVAAWAMPGVESPGPVLHRFYSRQKMAADGWWRCFRQRDAADSAASTLQRVDAVLNPPPDEQTPVFEQLAADAEAAAAALDEPRANQVRLAVAASALQRGRNDIARRVLAALSQRGEAPLPEELAWRWADALREARQWAEAAEQYEALWADNHDLLGALFLAGDALEHAGQADIGRKKKALADRLALDSARRRDLAAVLLSHGLYEEGVRQLRIVLRTAPLEHEEWNDAARLLGEQLLDSDPAAAAEWLELSILDDLRWNFYLLETGNYLRTPALIHSLRAKAAVAAGQFERAEAHVDLALAALPGDIRVAEQLVPLLDQAGRRAQADALFGRLYNVFDQRLQEYPRAAFLHNSMAGLSARCHRRLDEALEHAEKANQLAPDNASYLDTLAETHFHRGDRASAVRHSQRAKQLQPRDDKLKKQLARFKHDPLPN